MKLTCNNQDKIIEKVIKILNENGWSYTFSEIKENDAITYGDFLGLTPEQIAKKYMESNPEDKEN
ncbi:MAG: hypothetical protein PHF86_08415 [Candidatus Nanoarchaeia archaeon]|jgi:hypothetical protein|nr:hypothetical protein [Candidatus Nanoarchaeia archaeon]